nr:metalloregulator ArsR/SmtB family transcription factor [Robiginitomaculum antarcticum]
MTNALLDPKLFETKASEAAAMLRALSNERRLMILCRLSGGELSVGDLQKDSGLSQSAFSQHLAVLRDQGLVATRRESQIIYYSVSDPAALTIMKTLASIYCPEMLI